MKPQPIKWKGKSINVWKENTSVGFLASVLVSNNLTAGRGTFPFIYSPLIESQPPHPRFSAVHQVTALCCGHFAVAELIRGCTEQEAKRFLSPTSLVYQTLCNFLWQKCTDLEVQRLDFNIFYRELCDFWLSSSSVSHTVGMCLSKDWSIKDT